MKTTEQMVEQLAERIEKMSYEDVVKCNGNINLLCESIFAKEEWEQVKEWQQGFIKMIMSIKINNLTTQHKGNPLINPLFAEKIKKNKEKTRKQLKEWRRCQKYTNK